jgi:hypothetical protein
VVRLFSERRCDGTYSSHFFPLLGFTEKEYNSGDNLGFYRENHGVVTFVYRDSRGNIWGGLEKADCLNLTRMNR